MLKAEIIGNIGGNAVVKESNGRKYVSFSVAHTENKKDAQGNKTSETLWVSVSQSGDGGGLLQYLTKGTKVFVRGTLSARTYTDKDNQVKVGLSIYATEISLCGAKSDDGSTQVTATTHQASAQPQPAQAPPATDSTHYDLPF